MVTRASISPACSTWQQIANPLCTNQRRPTLWPGGWVRQGHNQWTTQDVIQSHPLSRIQHQSHQLVGIPTYNHYCNSQISNPWPVCKSFNRIISWMAGFKTGLVYTKSKSRPISQCVWSKSGPTHAVDGSTPCACDQRSLMCADKSYSSETQSG